MVELPLIVSIIKDAEKYTLEGRRASFVASSNQQGKSHRKSIWASIYNVIFYRES